MILLIFQINLQFIVDSFARIMDKYLIRKPCTQDSSPMQDSSSSSKRILVDFNLENLPLDLGLREKALVNLRNGNGSGSGRVFSYPDQTRGARPVARTRPVQGTGFFPGAQTRPRRAPRAPFRYWAQFVAQPKKKKKKPRFIFSYVQACIFKFKPR